MSHSELTVHITQSADPGNDCLAKDICSCLHDVRGVSINAQTTASDGKMSSFHQAQKLTFAGISVIVNEATSFVDIFQQFISALISIEKSAEADSLGNVLAMALDKKSFRGLQLDPKQSLTDTDLEELRFRIDAWLEALNSVERARHCLTPLASRAAGRRPMTITEKIFAHHSILPLPEYGLKPGDMVQTSVDWIIASEVSYAGMVKTLDEIGNPGIWRNDRLYIAGDHLMDPRIYNVPKVQELIKAAEKAKQQYRMTDYMGLNYTIMHTEFVRQRAQPGMLVIGADSHTCSAGAVSCVSIGLGAADVAMATVTGSTFFKVPECINVQFIGKPGPGIGGKDTILYILSEFKRNTVAAERIVEFSGPGTKYLSIDARFAISNMCTEFGAITGLFVPDIITKGYIDSRKVKRMKAETTYFLPDEDAQYATRFEIDLSKVQSFMAVYPRPDDVCPVSSKAGTKLDGVFIGACTTAEEDLILGALVLKVGLKNGFQLAKGKRHVVPGSLPIASRLEDLGLADVYREAGFTQGVPGCSFCVGMGADRAQPDEVWLSSQNRNFKNRMGKGSFGNITSAAAVAASSFSMEITDPTPFLSQIDPNDLNQYFGTSNFLQTHLETEVLPVKEPNFSIRASQDVKEDKSPRPSIRTRSQKIIKGKIQVLDDFIDTDALAPIEFLVGAKSDEDIGTHCLQHTHPEFVSKVKDGFNIIVAGKAFGCGSSREEAVRALKGCGVQLVIARSFSFIFGRNMPTLGLLGIVMSDDDFYKAATSRSEISVDVAGRILVVGEETFSFQLDPMEIGLIENKGVSEAYKRFGKNVFEKIANLETGSESLGARLKMGNAMLATNKPGVVEKLEW
ncbi:MAG: hypothetical protein M1834_009583 [Cirrosporium novae-zelandiae]|nr:MAG: hypothetical protein M1834_009583 [Cirrosporium novae-zelandiae]